MPSSQSSSAPDRSRGVGRQVVELDDTDREMVRLLRSDGRLSVRSLAEQVHISRANAYTRLERLHRDGVITGYAAQVDPDKLGLTTAGMVAVSIEQNTWQEVLDGVSAISGVERITLVGAEFDLLVEVRTEGNHELRDVVLSRIQAVPGVRGTRTWLVFDEWQR